MSQKKDKSIFEILHEIQVETGKKKGLIEKPDKKFHEWESDLEKWEKRLNKRMTTFEKKLNAQMGKIEKYFE